jgi:HEAT repeat protein
VDGPEPQVTNRRREVALAGHRGEHDAARAGLADPAPGVRATALGALLRLGRLDAGDVRAGLADPAPVVRARAAEVGVALGEQMAADIAGLLADPDPAAVEAACFALGELGGALATDPVVGGKLAGVARSHPDPLCREAAVAALGAIGAPWGLEAILAATEDKPAVRRRAVLALASYEGPDVDAALARALTDRDWQVRQAAEDMTGTRSVG